MMKSPAPLLAVAALAVAAPSFGQTLNSDAQFAAAAAEARAAVPAAKAPSSCPDAKELETEFDLRVTFPGGKTPLYVHFAFSKCDAEPRNDYLPPYTERDYIAMGPYGLTIVTDDGADSSEVLLSKGKDWVGRFGKQANAALVSGEAVAAGEVEVDGVKGSAVLSATDGVFPQTRACDAGIKKLAGYSPRNVLDKVATGFTPGPALVLLTDSEALYYHEDCEICAELDVCDLRTGATRAAVTAHAVSCADLAPYRKESGVVFDACTRY
jgi:hypothetical protein